MIKEDFMKAVGREFGLKLDSKEGKSDPPHIRETERKIFHQHTTVCGIFTIYHGGKSTFTH